MSFKLPEEVSRIHEFDTLISKISENIKNDKRPFEGCNKTHINELNKFIGGKGNLEIIPSCKRRFRTCI